MAEDNETQEAQAAEPKRNKDGLIPGQRVSAKELAAVRLKNRQAAKKASYKPAQQAATKPAAK